MAFKKATKHQLKLRLSLAGPSGSGKTWTSLAIATVLAGDKRVAVIDTERRSASKYSREFDFDVQELDTYSPQNYVDAIHEAERDGSYGVLIIDSLSHAWNGTGGLLELVDNIARRKYQGNTFAAWKDATPLQNTLIDAITGSPLHVIVTMRSKQEYTLEKDERTGKSTPKKHGMAPVQRDGLEYEFDVAVDMDIDNTMIVQKSRCSELSGQVISKPGANVATILQKWLDDGSPAPIVEYVAPSVIDALTATWASVYRIPDEQIETRWPKYKVHVLGLLVPDEQLQAAHLATLKEVIEAQRQKVSPPIGS